MKKSLTLFFLLLFSISLSAQDVVRAMFYNLWDFPSARIQGRDVILKRITDRINPDLIMVCELESEEGGQMILNALNSNGNEYAMAPFFPSASGDLEHQQLIFFKSKKFNLEHSEPIPTAVRDINYYDLKLNTADGNSDPIHLHVFVTHLKSSQGNANKQARLEMVEKFVEKTGTLNPDSFVLFSGDFNLYTNTEPAYQLMINPANPIPLTDPIQREGSWHGNRNFMDVHTQSTRSSSTGFGGGAGGGLDDRFDFIMMSSNMRTNPKLMYSPDTYISFGNNGNCFKESINDPECDGFYDQETRNDLYWMSDHLPVVMEFTTNKTILGTNSYDYTAQPLFTLPATVVSNILNVSVNEEHLSNTDFEIYNVLGQKVMEFGNWNSKHVSIDISALSEGMYYLKARAPQSPTLKFIKSF